MTDTTPTPDEAFVLDRTENPHPRMLTEAHEVRDLARRNVVGPARFEWIGYLRCMCAATGETPDDIERWMDRAVSGDGQRPQGP
jgi:hypothetical protein